MISAGEYLALTESHCNTLITQQTGKQHESEQEASDERCEKEPSSRSVS